MARLLLVDHQLPRRSYLSIILEQDGHQTQVADTVAEAIALLRRHPPDLLLLDIFSPDPGGYRFLRCLQKEKLLGRTRIVFLVAPYLLAEARLLAQSCGITRVIADNISSADLQGEIREALSEPSGTALPFSTAGLEDSLSRLLGRLHGRIGELESTNARLERRARRSEAQLELARNALDEEVEKRKWNEAELQRENLLLRIEAVRDPLTGLYNRRYLEESLAREESRAKRNGYPLSVMMIDIDHFKRYNDTYGHAAGDAVLRAVSNCMASLARREDILCRYGGEEFVLVMTNIPPDAIRQRADTLHRGIPRLHIEHNHQAIGPITLSIGVAMFPDNGSSAKAVLEVADAALYKAKNSGRNQVVVG